MDGGQPPQPAQQSSTQATSPPRIANTPHLATAEHQQPPPPTSSHHRAPQYHSQHHQSPRQPQIHHQQYHHLPSTLQPPQHYRPTAQQASSSNPQHHPTNVSPAQTQQPSRIPATSSSQQSRAQIVADPKEDWTKSLVKMAKTAELKKHALTLQLHTTHILSQHSNLHKKEKVLEDLKGQRQHLEQERAQLLDRLRGVNEEREKVDLNESKVHKECEEIRRQIQHMTDTEYASAKHEVDALRQELGLEAVKSLQAQIEEKSATYRRQNKQPVAQPQTSTPETPEVMSPSRNQPAAPSPSRKRGPEQSSQSAPTSTPITSSDHTVDGPPIKRPRGRPKGSKNKPKDPAKLDGVEGAADGDATPNALSANEPQ
ncbi:hypothetical protein FRC02_006617 [Tulasnella sp. 418]|nr:hypothetical protein FRC02_006617 [Tulasnella sp. 418]